MPLTQQERAAAREWMTREGFILRVPDCFIADTCSENVQHNQQLQRIYSHVAEQLTVMAQAYREAARERE